MVGDTDWRTVCKIIGERLALEDGVWVKYTYIKGCTEDSVGMSRNVGGWSGAETEFRRVVVPPLHTFEVVERMHEAA
jgi:hypothetical protein